MPLLPKIKGLGATTIMQVGRKPRTTQYHKWTSPLKLFEKEHLLQEGIRSKKELEESIAWAEKYTEQCEKCKLILTKLGSTEK